MSFQTGKFASASLLVLVALGASASCRDKPGPYIPLHVPFAYVQPDCGPTDGPALTFYFTSKQVHSGKYEEPFVEVSIYESLPRFAPTDYAIGARGGHVWASRCTSAGKCANAIAGSSLHINTVGAKGVSGVLHSIFKTEALKRALSTQSGLPQSHNSSAGVSHMRTPPL